jgi:hypothetical protein
LSEFALETRKEDTVLWGDVVDLLAVAPLSIVPVVTVVDPSHQLINVRTKQPHVFRFVVSAEFVGNIWLTETAVVEVQFLIRIGVGKANRVFGAVLTRGPPYDLIAADFEAPAQGIQVSSKMQASFTIPGEHLVKSQAYAAPFGVILRKEDLC